MRTREYLGDFELMVMLALLRLGDNAYGVPISREIEQETGRNAALGSVYATLERLEEKGLVSSELGEPTSERGGRAKRYFRVTPKGLRAVREMRQALTRLWRRLPQLEEGGHEVIKATSSGHVAIGAPHAWRQERGPHWRPA